MIASLETASYVYTSTRLAHPNLSSLMLLKKVSGVYMFICCVDVQVTEWPAASCLKIVFNLQNIGLPVVKKNYTGSLFLLGLPADQRLWIYSSTVLYWGVIEIIPVSLHNVK